MTIQISCVVLSYNGGNSLIRTLESCKLQTYLHKDLVVADDASTDNGYTVSVIEKWLADNSKFFTNVLFIKNTSNMGIVKNLRNASLQAQGEIIFGLGQGDLAYAPNTLEIIAAGIEKQRQIDPVDPFFWLGEYLGYKVEKNGELKIIQLYKDLPHQHKLLIKNPYKALKRNLRRWEIGGVGIVYHKKYYCDDVYPLTHAPRNWEDGPAFIWALAEQKKIGILNFRIRWYEIGTGISWQNRTSKTIKNVIKEFFNIIVPNQPTYTHSRDKALVDYAAWLETLNITDFKIRQIVERHKQRLLLPQNQPWDRIIYACRKAYAYILSELQHKINIFIYNIFTHDNLEFLNKDKKFLSMLLTDTQE